ncbi:hypothetical protein [Micromonospora tulbaghiae]|uniref:hypothetical protein n=1 Tax=Micromonospora tulbaghiae TaxID=479978 RepID=UPI003419EEA2
MSSANILDQMKNAAYERENERRAVERGVEEIVLGENPNRRYRVTAVITLGDDHLVEVHTGDRVMWTFVIDGRRSGRYHYTQEQAILHLIAARYDNSPGDSYQMSIAAGRVLGITEGGPSDND